MRVMVDGVERFRPTDTVIVFRALTVEVVPQRLLVGVHWREGLNLCEVLDDEGGVMAEVEEWQLLDESEVEA